jgi:UDP-2,3-diacylglucosamine hydrolase
MTMSTKSLSTKSSVGIIAGNGTLPSAVASSLQVRGIRPVIFAIRGFCDPQFTASFEHHWIALGQFGRLARLLRSENIQDVVFIGTLVRPALSEVRLDWGTIRIVPKIAAAMRGGDNHLLSGVARIFEQHGFRLIGVQDAAPDLLVPEGNLARYKPDAEAENDIQKGMAVLRAMSPFDIGQAVIVINGHVVGLEDIEGTDGLLARIARLRELGRIRAKPGHGVLVKAPKISQDLRLDLPTLGPKTIEGVAAAGLSGVAIVAGQTIIAEPQKMIEIADRSGVFVTGIPA